MPELPEVETTRRGIAPHVTRQKIRAVEVRQRQLRWPIPDSLEQTLRGQIVLAVERRAKYLLFRTTPGTAILHLGMSGSLRVVNARTALKTHDHVDIALANGKRLRYHDPRRFGALLWTADPPAEHPLLRHLGPEPLSDDFNGDRLFQQSHNPPRRLPVKQFIMDGKVVVGVGNIYASEALFLAGIRPQREAGKISRARYQTLAETIKKVLADAIRQGGTTLRDFVNSSGEPGYFSQSLNVYGRADQPCPSCAAPVKMLRIGQRSTFYCSRCQR